MPDNLEAKSIEELLVLAYGEAGKLEFVPPWTENGPKRWTHRASATEEHRACVTMTPLRDSAACLALGCSFGGRKADLIARIRERERLRLEEARALIASVPPATRTRPGPRLRGHTRRTKPRQRA